MSTLLVIGAAVLAVYAAFVVALIVAGHRPSLRDLARFIPDCIVLVSRLLRDPRVPRRHKLILGALVGYLALPFDIVPDFDLDLMQPGQGLSDLAARAITALDRVIGEVAPDLVVATERTMERPRFGAWRRWAGSRYAEDRGTEGR